MQKLLWFTFTNDVYDSLMDGKKKLNRNLVKTGAEDQVKDGLTGAF